METTSCVSTFHPRDWSEEEEHGRLPKRMRHDDAHEYPAILPPPPPVPSSSKRGRLSVDEEEDKEAEEPRASKILQCESAEAAARSERTAQLLLRFANTIERAKHKMDDGSTRVSAAASGGSSYSSGTRAHKREEQSPDEQLQVEVEEMPILTPEIRHRMLNARLSEISSKSLVKWKFCRFSLQQD